MKAVIAVFFTVLLAHAAPQSDMDQRVPLKLAHLRAMKEKDPQTIFRLRTPEANNVVGQISKIVLDAEGQRPKFALVLLFEQVARNGAQIVVPWEALSISTNRHELFVNSTTEKLRQAKEVQPKEVPDRAPPDWGTQYYAFFGVQPQQAPPERGAAGMAEMIGGVVKGSGSSEQRMPVADVNRGNAMFIWLGLILVAFAVFMVARRVARRA